MTMQKIEVELATLAFTVEGPEDAPPILLLMGLGGSAAEWGDEFLDRLRKGHRVIRMDNRGVGGSTNAAKVFNMSDMASDARAVLDALQLGAVHVLGYSMGGMIAQQLAIESPERVARLVLLSTHFGGAGVVPMLPRAQAVFEPQPPGSTREQYLQKLFVHLCAPGFGEQNLSSIQDFVVTRLRNPLPILTYSNQLDALLASDRSEGVAGLSMPTLVVHGDLDPLLPLANGQNLASRIPGSEFCELRGCGHLPTWESPQEVAEAVLGFLKPSVQS